MLVRRFLLVFTVLTLGLAFIWAGKMPHLNVAKAASPANTLTIPLYRYQSKSGSGVYAAYPDYRKSFSPSIWDEFGVVGHVYPQKKAGTLPLLALRKPINGPFNNIYFYTTDINEAIKKQNAGWIPVQYDKGVIGYVATSPKAGTIAVYRYQQPTLKGGYIYAYGEAENNTLKEKPDLKFDKLAFYVWANPVESSSSFPTGSTVDLSLRQALYFNGISTAKVNTASKYVLPDAMMTLHKNQALECAGDSCTFNLGFFIFRNSTGGKLSSYAQLSGSSIGSSGNSFSFTPGQKIKDFVLAVKLKMGENKIKVTVDPYQKTAETDENNNGFEVTILLEP